MKRIYIGILFIVIVFICASAEFGYISAKTDLFISLINQADQAVEKENYSTAMELCSEIESKWQETSVFTNTMLNHNDIDKIDVNFAKMISHIKSQNIYMYFSESTEAKKTLTYIKESECPNFENIL